MLSWWQSACAHPTGPHSDVIGHFKPTFIQPTVVVRCPCVVRQSMARRPSASCKSVDKIFLAHSPFAYLFFILYIHRRSVLQPIFGVCRLYLRFSFIRSASIFSFYVDERRLYIRITWYGRLPLMPLGCHSDAYVWCVCGEHFPWSECRRIYRISMSICVNVEWQPTTMKGERSEHRIHEYNDLQAADR